jgi:hypothetical protein
MKCVCLGCIKENKWEAMSESAMPCSMSALTTTTCSRSMVILPAGIGRTGLVFIFAVDLRFPRSTRY